MPELRGLTIQDNLDKKPYIYHYVAEDIRNWSINMTAGGSEFNAVLLRDRFFSLDKKTNLPLEEEIRFRYIWLGEDGKVHVQFYDSESKLIDQEIILDIEKIPFVLLELPDSLLIDTADYQISLLNLSSSDMAWVLKSNFPFYIEQFDPRSESSHLRQAQAEPLTVNETIKPGEAADIKIAKPMEIKVGSTAGRRYPKDIDRPGFIHPSSEPLLASMKKQDELKAEIRQLNNLAVTNLTPRMASAESKAADERSLESGLSAIGLELQHAESLIAKYWAIYEGNKDSATIIYPRIYSLKSDEENRKDADSLDNLKSKVPSPTYQKSVSKEIARITVGNKVSTEEMIKIEKEIDTANVLTSDVDIIQKDVELGLIGLDLASNVRGYPKGEVDKAKKDHTDRLARIAEAQSKASEFDGGPRGVNDKDDTPKTTSRKEKEKSRETDQDDEVKDKTRGIGK